METIKQYENNIEKLKLHLNKLKNKSTFWSGFRVVVFIVLVLLIFNYSIFSVEFFIFDIIFFVALLLMAVKISLKINSETERVNTLIAINTNETSILSQGENLYFDGEKFSQKHPDLANDLNIFNKNSVYHLLNRSKSYFGVEKLKNFLVELISNEAITERQNAIQELSAMEDWRHEFQYTLFKIDHSNDYKNISNYIKEKSFLEDKKSLFNFYFILNYILLAVFIASLLFFSKYSFSIFVLLFLINSFISMIYIQKTNKIHIKVSGIADDLEAFVNALKLIEKPGWETALLTRLKNENNNYSGNIKNLKQLIQKFDFRLNMLVGSILNILFLWDLRIIAQIDKWKKENKDLNKHLNIIGEFEALSSFATLKYNNPQYSFPVISEKEFEITAKNMLHPLIDKSEVVANDFSVDGNSKLDIITGPNMSGKSTFLRSIGINMILARSGSIVFADEFVFTPSKVLTYLHITDSVLEKVSTFKAEILKLKRILEDIKTSKEPVYFILDEILRGTNSVSKYKGSVAIAKKLLELHASGIIATHDVKLGNLEEEYPKNINNYSFDFIQDEKGELVYDYKLKHGINDKVNADIVLKELGLILE